MGTQAPLPKKEAEPGGGAPGLQFSALVCCGQTAGWIKIALGTEVGLGPVHIVLDGDTTSLPKKGQSPPIFGPSLLWQAAGRNGLCASTGGFLVSI